MGTLFVTATGTGLGKTMLTAALVHQIRASGSTVRALKPVVSGYEAGDPDSDTAILARVLGGVLPDEISPWRFAAPLSPDMAAAREGRRIDIDALISWCRICMEKEGLTLIEGIGGAFVPLEGNYLVADWIASLGCPFLLVAGNYLGTLSHTIATAEALAARGLVPHAVVVSDSPSAPVSPEETVAALATRLSTPVLPLPRVTGSEPWKRAPDLSALLAISEPDRN